MQFDLLELLFPSRCFGCRALGPEICNECRRNWNPHIYLKRVSNIRVYSALPYTETAREIILSSKERAIEVADRLIVEALIHCLKRIPEISLRNLVFIPIPSTKRAIRRRGRNFLEEITAQVAKYSQSEVINCLEINRKILDQTKLNAINRAENLLNAYVVNPNSKFLQGKKLIIIDDLITTGSTIKEANRALQAAGFDVTCAITACVAKPLR